MNLSSMRLITYCHEEDRDDKRKVIPSEMR